MFRRLVSALRRRPRPDRVWAGVYGTFPETSHQSHSSHSSHSAHSSHPSHPTPYSTSAAVEAAERLLDETRREPMPHEAVLDHQVLALAVRLASASPVSVIDMGGGMGQSYAALRRMLPRDVALRYRVMDLPEVVARGRAIWSGNDEIELAEGIDAGDFPADVVFAKGVLQYFEDFRGQLRNWFRANARFVLLEKLPVVNAPTYVTMQENLYGRSLPYWMFHLGDLEAVGRECGYAIALQRRLERVYDQSDFPPELRMERATSLLFERLA